MLARWATMVPELRLSVPRGRSSNVLKQCAFADASACSGEWRSSESRWIPQLPLRHVNDQGDESGAIQHGTDETGYFER